MSSYARDASQLDVLHVASGDFWGGSEAQVAFLLPALAARGHRVRAVLFNSGRLEQELQTARVRVDVIPEQDGMLALWRGLRGNLRSTPADLVHAHGYKEALTLFSASVGLPVRRVRTLHGVPEVPLGGVAWRLALYTRLERWLSAWLQVRGIAVSQALFEAESPHWRSRLSRVPNAVDIGVPQGSVPPNERDRLPVMLYAGRLEPVKGPDILLEAMPAIRKAVPDVRLWLAGEGSLRSHLEGRIAQLGLEGAVELLGQRDDVDELIEAARLVVLPSRGEGMPTLLLEALAAGRPVVATRVGGMPEVTRDGALAVLVPSGEPIAFAQACIRVLTDDGLRKRLELLGPPEMQARYTPESVAVQTEAVYRLLLSDS